ncbi:glycine-rich protein [Rhodococcus sp. USK13]|uniref:glycine-rich protein n=1 Tax=Rhodococcus sp. USK13 TaxID=2806442 RepID=UPI0024B49F99|nr:glycine-rich protein [Rhodococcus sp. USK13]
MTDQHTKTRRRWYTSGVCGVAVVGASALLAPGVAVAAPALPTGCVQGSGSTVTCTFTFTGGAQSFTVPEGITSLDVTATGARGGNAASVLGGFGAVASRSLPVTPGDALYVLVGGNGGDGTGAAGFNGGGASGTGAGGGGGASDVRIGTGELADRQIVASGGGGAGDTYIGGGGNLAPNAPAGQAGGGGGAGVAVRPTRVVSAATVVTIPTDRRALPGSAELDPRPVAGRRRLVRWRRRRRELRWRWRRRRFVLRARRDHRCGRCRRRIVRGDHLRGRFGNRIAGELVR